MYQRKLSSCFILIFFILILGSFVSAQDKISVIVIKDPSFAKIKNFSISYSSLQISEEEVTRHYSSVPGFSANVSYEEYEKLKRDSTLKVFEDRKFYASLDKSASQIEANSSWLLKINGTNLTGIGQTVCVIDTGVNYSHSAFGNCYGNNNASSSCTILGGYDFVNNDADPMDDNGHGTHVSGIIASSNSIYKGISPGAKIIAIKALDSTGSGNSMDVLAGIDWCINNASKFNISVISMSLGDNSTHNSYCNSDFFASYINNAVSKNISVVVAAGNCDQPGQMNCTVGISSPACVQNATAVGTVNDSDTVFFMRGNLFELLAPGVNIISSILNGGYAALSGTSMSTPHVAASIAVLQQMSSLQNNRKLTGAEIKFILNNTGARIDDTANSGYNFSRINVYNALLSLDNVAPNVTLISPINNTVNFSQNQTISFNATDWQLKSATVYLWNSSGLYNSSSVNMAGTDNFSSVQYFNLPYGNYKWNVFVSDENNNSAFAEKNFSLTIGGVFIENLEPKNNIYTNVNFTNFSCSAKSDPSYDLTNMTFHLFNSSIEIFNETKNLTGLEDNKTFNVTFSQETNYTWFCLALNNNSQNSSTENCSINYDLTTPEILDLSTQVTSSSATITWTTNEKTNYSISVQNLNESNYSINHSLTLGGLSASTSYNYNLTFCDLAENCNLTSESFTTSSYIQRSSGGGGGGGSSVQRVISETDLQNGKTQTIFVGEKLIFSLVNVNHTIKLNKIVNNSANITIQSEPVNFLLSVGEERKINLNSELFYVLIKLENVSYLKANFTLQVINEKNDSLTEKVENITGNESYVETPEKENNNKNYIWIVGGFIFFVLVVIVVRKLNQKRLKTNLTVKEYEKVKA